MRGKWTTLAALCALFSVYTVDRALLGLLAVPIQAETGMSNVRFGLLSATVFWTYALVAPFGGLAGDRFDRARLIAFAALAWSLATLLAGFAAGFWSLLLLASVATVVPQTLYAPSANALLASLHMETRTVAMSCHQAAYYTGWFASGAVVAGIVSAFGSWRAAFVVMGAVGLAAGLAFLAISGGRRRDEAARMTANGAASGATRSAASFRASMAAFWGCRSACLASVGYVAVVFVSCGYCAWGPKFVAEKFALSASEAGAGVMFGHYAASFAAILAAGALTDRLVRRFPRTRLVMGMCAFACAIPSLLLFAYGPTKGAAFAGATLLGAAFGVLGANQFTNVFDVIPAAFRAGAIGFMNVVAGLVGALSPVLLGALSQRDGLAGFERGFAAMGAAMTLAIAALLVSCLVTFNKERIRE